jgi:uncharacterized RDD family membrane protein YckC
MPSPLVSGPTSLRHPRERVAFVLTLLFAFPIAYAIGFVIHERIGPPEVALFIVIAMLYVTLARGRLIGSSVMIHEAQYPRLFGIVKRTCAALDLPMPLIFIREDNFVPVVALGFGEPYSLVISSHWIEAFEDDELSFMVGRELGHIAAGHTRYLSLLSVNGNENPIVALVFGGWLRSCAVMCDRIGLLACDSLDAAARAIAISSFHEFGRQIDIAQFAEQGREIASDGVLRLGEWLGGEPYATRRIADMKDFMASPHYAQAKAWFYREIGPEPPTLASSANARVQFKDCAGFWRRTWAFAIDLIVISAIITALTSAHTGESDHAAKMSAAPITVNIGDSAKTTSKPSKDGSSSDNDQVTYGPVHIDDAGIHFDVRKTPLGRAVGVLQGYAGSTQALAIAAYLWLLVGFTGQSFGMMITGLRVVRTDFRPPGVWRSLARYLILLTLYPLLILLAPFMRRVMLHDRWTKTRVIRAERIMARAAATPATATAATPA